MPKSKWHDEGKNYQPIKKVAENYVKMMESGAILSNRSAIDVLDSRVLALMDRIDTEESPERITALYNLFQEFKSAREARNETEAIKAMAAMDAAFDAIYHDYRAWGQMIEVLDLRRKMVDSEVKIIKEQKHFLSVEMAFKLVSQLLAVCIRVVQDPEKLKIINYEFSRIIGEDRLLSKAGGETLEEE